MTPTAVINVVGLTKALLGPDTPHLNSLAADGASAPVRAVTPAVTCSAQSTFLTGLLPRDHGIVGNGWYFRDVAQVMFWKQANQLVAVACRVALVEQKVDDFEHRVAARRKLAARRQVEPDVELAKPALQATLHPTPSKALYFVSRGDGTSQFSEDLAAHNRAVNKYQRGR